MYFSSITEKIVFKPKDESLIKKGLLKSSYFNIPLGFVSRFENSIEKRGPEVVYLDIYSKDGRIFKFRIDDKYAKECNTLRQYINILAFPDKMEYFFAFEHAKFNRAMEEQYQGWKIYDIEKEFHRQGIEFHPLTDSGAIPNTNVNFPVIVFY